MDKANNLQKIDLGTIEYQGWNNFYCPGCDFSFLETENWWQYIIGYGDLTISMKYDNNGLVFECPKCFIKSWCHTMLTKDLIKDKYEELKNG